MRCDARPWVVEEQEIDAIHVPPTYSCTSPLGLLMSDRKITSWAATDRQTHETTCHSPVVTSLATPAAAARSAHRFNVLSPDRARAARSHLGSSWHTTSVPIRTMQVDGANRWCIMFMLLSVYSETIPPHACRPLAFSLHISNTLSLPRPFAHGLARQNVERAALLATKAGRRTVV